MIFSLTFDRFHKILAGIVYCMFYKHEMSSAMSEDQQR